MHVYVCSNTIRTRIRHFVQWTHRVVEWTPTFRSQRAMVVAPAASVRWSFWCPAAWQFVTCNETETTSASSSRVSWVCRRYLFYVILKFKLIYIAPLGRDFRGAGQCVWTTCPRSHSTVQRLGFESAISTRRSNALTTAPPFCEVEKNTVNW